MLWAVIRIALAIAGHPRLRLPVQFLYGEMGSKPHPPVVPMETSDQSESPPSACELKDEMMKVAQLSTVMWVQRTNMMKTVVIMYVEYQKPGCETE